MKLTVQAPGKLVLMGEYAVLEGAPALVMAVDRLALATFTPAEADLIVVEAPQIGVHAGPISLGAQPPELAPELRVVGAALAQARATLAERGVELHACRLGIDTAALYEGGVKLGLGSSAAVAAAVFAGALRLALPDFDLEAERGRLLPAVLAAHRAGHAHSGSGVDVAASWMGGVLCFAPSKPDRPLQVEPVRLPPDLHFLAVWTGSPAATEVLVGAVRELRRRSPHVYERLMTELGTLAAASCDRVRQGKAADFLTLVGQYCAVLAALGTAAGAPIVSAPHLLLSELAQKSGVAYKPSGAGGGDFGIGFSDDPSALEAFRQAVYIAGLKPLALRPQSTGVRFG